MGGLWRGCHRKSLIVNRIGGVVGFPGGMGICWVVQQSEVFSSIRDFRLDGDTGFDRRVMSSLMVRGVD